ncbi:MAG: hypothetical protein Q7S26_01780 [bacterium]|nr:hypothetical protein [bacterium]
MMRRVWIAGFLFALVAVPLAGYAGELPRQQVVAKSPPKGDTCNRNPSTGLCPEEGGAGRQLLKFGISGNFMQPPNQNSASNSR